MTQTLLLFSAVAFIPIATPGPTVLLALTNGSRCGARASLAGMGGAVLSDIVLVSAVAMGLGALLVALGLVFAAIDFVAMFACASASASACAGVQAVRLLHDRGLPWLERFSGGALLALAGSLAPGRQPMRSILALAPRGAAFILILTADMICSARSRRRRSSSLTLGSCRALARKPADEREWAPTMPLWRADRVRNTARPRP